MSLSQVYKALEEISAFGGQKAKVKLLAKAVKEIPFFKETVFFALNPYMVYNISKVTFLKGAVCAEDPSEIFDMLKTLSKSRGVDRFTAVKLYKLASCDEETVEVVSRIVKKDLRCGVSIKTARKVMPEIPIHELQLCDVAVRYVDGKLNEENQAALEKFIKNCGGWDEVIPSTKLDGVRCWAVVHESGYVEYLSRSGKAYPNFHLMSNDLHGFVENIRFLPDNRRKYDYPFIIDGEVTCTDEDFQKQMTQLRRLKEADPSIFRFKVFDTASMPEKTLNLKALDLIDACDHFKTVEVLKQDATLEELGITSIEEFTEYFFDIVGCGFEGLVLKAANKPYEFKRSKYWCKVKPFLTGEFKVTGIYEGTGRNKHRLGGVNIEGDDTEGKVFITCDVGSGFTDEQREEFYTEDFIGTMIEVEYQEITPDKSLRFPSFVRVREDK